MVGGGFAPALRAARRFGRRRVRALPLQTTALSLSLRLTHILELAHDRDDAIEILPLYNNNPGLIAKR
jgi:hypothetical protein